MTTNIEGNPPTEAVITPQPVIGAVNTGPVKMGPGGWRQKLRPMTSANSLHEDRLFQQSFDVHFAAAKFAKKWEDDWPQLTKDEFTSSMIEITKIQIGGQNPDGSHPSNKKG